MYLRLFFRLSIGLITLLNGAVSAQVLEYTEQTGGAISLLKINISHFPDGKEIVFTTPDIHARHVVLDDSGTQSWIHKDEERHHDFKAEREGNHIHISGTFDGKPIQKTVDIDGKQWFNKLDHGLSDWVATDEEELVFWTLKLSSDLDPIEFRAEKISEEKIKLAGGTFNTIKVKLSLEGLLLSKLWSAYCWYDIESGIFLKFEGVNGGPGTPISTIELSKGIAQ